MSGTTKEKAGRAAPGLFFIRLRVSAVLSERAENNQFRPGFQHIIIGNALYR